MRRPSTLSHDPAGCLTLRDPGGRRLPWPVALPVIAALAALAWLGVLAVLRFLA